MPASRKNAAVYAALVAAAAVLGVLASWFVNPFLDNNAYDFFFRLYRPQPWPVQSAILAIDEKTLQRYGGVDGIRQALADGLRVLAPVRPKAVAIDIILADRGGGRKGNPDSAAEKVDADLAKAFGVTPNLVLDTEVLENEWEEPLPEFARYAAAIGHVHVQPDADNVVRKLLLEKHVGTQRRWALALEAYRLSRGGRTIVEDRDKLVLGDVVIPAPMDPVRPEEGRPMRIRYIPDGYPQVPRVSLVELVDNNSLVTKLTGKVVFVGVTAASAEVRDRVSTPYSNGRLMPGIEVNANAFETLAQGLFLTDARDFWVLLFSFGIAAAIGLAFRYLPGWMAYAGGGLALAGAMAAPYIFFTHRVVFSFATPALAAWLSFLAAAAYYHLVTRRNWRTEKAARSRYQQAMHFVTHEMRTPLSAIQGSSELISRYALTEEKRKQIALLINSESKRLARMVEIFLNVERLSAGQMELKHEKISIKDLIDICIMRARPLAERKRIAIALDPIAENVEVTGDRELMEYACYNLLTNAVKYSPQETEITVSGTSGDGEVRISVKDQGIGMDQKELKQIFQKFYRTRKAEESGEAGTGIGLSIVQQIVEQHGGTIHVTSQPGAGSCFTLALPEARASASAAAEHS
jgi:signal transduction histidine kinase